MGVDVLGSGVVDIWPQGPMCPMAIDGQRRSGEGDASCRPFAVETALDAVSAESPQADLIPPLSRNPIPSGSDLVRTLAQAPMPWAYPARRLVVVGEAAAGQAVLSGGRCARGCQQSIRQCGHQGRRQTTLPASAPYPYQQNHRQPLRPDASFPSTARSQDGAVPNAPRAVLSGHRRPSLTAEDGGLATDFTTQLRKGGYGENSPLLMTAGPDPLCKTDGAHLSPRARQMRPCHPQILSDIALSPTF